MPEPLPADLAGPLEHNAAARGRFGHPALFFPEVGSTNDIAMALADRGAPEGAMIVAHAQSAGRGRLGRHWISPPGAGLYVSLVCRNQRAAPLLTLAGGVAVADGIRAATGLPVVLKWPNDVYVADGSVRAKPRKIAGILAEASSNAGGLQYVVLGFGINLRPAKYPPGVRARATSVEQEIGRPVEAGAVLAETLAAFNEQVSRLSEGAGDAVLDRWRALSPSASGASVEWAADGATRSGKTAGIDRDGALLVATGEGMTRIVAGELTWK